MSPEGYARKRNFVRRDLHHFVCGLFLEVSALEIEPSINPNLQEGGIELCINICKSSARP